MEIRGITGITKLERHNADSGFRELGQDFDAIAAAIQNGDLAAAQPALAKFRQCLEKQPKASPARKLFEATGPLGKDFQRFQTAVQANDAVGARAALGELINAIKKLVALQ